MSSSKNKIQRLKDKSDSNVIDKGLIDNVPFRCLLCGASGLGKTNFLANMILKNEWYNKEFYGDDIYIFSPLKNDNKMHTIISQKEIPESNIFTEFDEDILKEIYDLSVREFEERTNAKKRIYNKLIILDDLSYSGVLRAKQMGQINRVFCNGRKHNISIIITSQKYTQISPVQRSNFTSAVLYNTANSQVEAIEMDVNFLKTRKAFKKMFRDNVDEKRDFLYVNFSNEKKDIYLNKDFKVIDQDKYD
tara:strand:- start:701 stop:1444 length:744 start_codon:yes stop_codon:yes gene_type:complete